MQKIGTGQTRILKCIAVAIGALFFLTAASQITLSAYAQTASPIVQTPLGPNHADCVHEVPNGDIIVANDTVVSPNGTVFARYSPCDDPIAASVPSGPSSCQYALGADYNYTSPAIGQFNATWKVPGNPTNNGGFFYLWIGLEPSTSCAGATTPWVMQPLLQWGYNNIWGGNYWTISSWYFQTASNYFYSTDVSASQGDNLDGIITAFSLPQYGCNSGGTCSYWAINIDDKTAGTASGFTCSSSSYICNLQATTAYAAFEVHTGTCTDGEFPSSSTTFTIPPLENSNGNNFTPSWNTFSQIGCGSVTVSSGGGNTYVEIS